MNKMFSLILFAVIFVGLIIFNRDVVLPFAVDIVGSDLFLVDTEDKGDTAPVSNILTNYAYMHCNTHISENLDPDLTINFQPKPINVWSIGNHQYVVNGEIEITRNTSDALFRKYVCRIKHDKGSDEIEAMNAENWSLFGLSGLDDI